jgi:hypothetical protein
MIGHPRIIAATLKAPPKKPGITHSSGLPHHGLRTLHD